MKKQSIVLVWSAIVLFVIIASLIVIYFADDSSKKYTAEEHNVFSCASDRINKYTVKDKNYQYTIEKNDENWLFQNEEVSEIEMDVFRKVLACAANIKAIGTVNDKQFSRFNTEETKELEICTDDGRSAVIVFCGRLDELCAFSVKGDKQIYVMYAATMEILTPQPDAVRVKKVFPNLATKETLPEYYCYESSAGDCLEIRQKSNQELVNGKDNRYAMEKPFKRDVVDELFEQQIALNILALKIQAYENPIKELSDYGLDKDSRSQLRFRWDGEEIVLFLGAFDDGAVYAAKQDFKSVFKINSSQLEFLDYDPFFLLERGILRADIQNVSAVKVSYGEKKYEILTKKQDGNARCMINGNIIGNDDYQAIMDKLDNLSIESEIDTVPENKNDITLKITYDNGAAVQNISFTKIKDKAYAMFEDNRAEFVVGTDDMNELLKVLEETANSFMIN